MSVWFAAGIDGLLFGIVHASSTSLTALPILAFLGFVFCYVYERTGTLFATIALHALNNTISYGVATHNGWVASLVVGGVVIGGCVLGVMRAPRGVPVPA
jgi:membrane protease YdiL (CAAX protease family)